MGVLITGATGNLGSRLVAEYVAETSSDVYLVVRGSTDADACEKVDRALSFWGLELGELEGRVHVLRGDVERPRLGLSDQALERIRSAVRRVIHAASRLELEMSLEVARRSIVDGTVHAVEVAQQLRHLELFAFVSTLEIVGAYRGVLHEEFVGEYGIPLLNNYERAKLEAEEYLRALVVGGFPATVIRPSMVVGESTSGRIPHFQSFYLLLEKVVVAPEYPWVPDEPPLDVVPVDFAATMIRRIVESQSHARDHMGRVYHLCEGEAFRSDFETFRALSLPAVGRALGRTPRSPRAVPARLFRSVLALSARMAKGRARRSLEIQSMFLAFFGNPGRLTNPKTRHLAGSFGLEWPRLEDYVERLVDHYMERRHTTRMPF